MSRRAPVTLVQRGSETQAAEGPKPANHEGRGVRGLTAEASPQSAVASGARSGPRAGPGQRSVRAGSTNVPAD